MRELVIIGCGGHGRETLDVVQAINAQSPTWDFLGFLDDAPGHPDRLERRGVEVLGGVDDARTLGHAFVIGIGDAATRARIDQALGQVDSPVLVHPQATVASDNRLGPGTVMAVGARVTTNVTTGRHTHLNVNAVVSHDSVLGDHVTLSPAGIQGIRRTQLHAGQCHIQTGFSGHLPQIPARARVRQ